MSTPRPTPETDTTSYNVYDMWKFPHMRAVVDPDVARKLERERDEARESKDRISKRAEAIRCELVEKGKQLAATQLYLDEARERLRLLDWTPVTERLPTIEDANEYEDVEWSDGQNIWQNSCYLPNSNQHKATHWRRITLP